MRGVQRRFDYGELDTVKRRFSDQAYEKLWFKVLPLWLESGSVAEVTVLELQPSHLWLHRVKVWDKWGNQRQRNERCSREECCFCRDGSKAKRRVLYSVVDHRRLEYVNTYGKSRSEQHIIRYLDLSPKEDRELQALFQRSGSQEKGTVVVRVQRKWGEVDLGLNS